MRTLLDGEEMEILTALDKKEAFDKPSKEDIQKYRESAQYTKSQLQKKQTTIRFSVADLAIVKAKAKELGIGYQNLIQMLVHHYATGKIKIEL